MAKQDEQDDRERQRFLRQTRAELREVLHNEDGFRRLKAIGDAEWEAAAEADEAAAPTGLASGS